MKRDRRPDEALALHERKESHLILCENGPVEFSAKTTLFEEVQFFHDALPDLALDEIDVSVEFLGKKLQAPLLVTGMTGGTREAFEVNRDLAIVAERCGIGIGLGSQRVMQRSPETAWTFAIREFAPTTALLANIGLTQAARMKTADLEELAARVGADGLCIHLNPAQELIQPEGDRDFRGGTETFRRLVQELRIPVIAKETGCGISLAVAERLCRAGVQYVDVSGAGGTSWVKVEMLRGQGSQRRLGETFADWGIPTAASLAMLRHTSLRMIASGGIRSGLEMAKGIALGAELCGVALPVYRAYKAGGIDAATALVKELIAGLKTAMLLTGSKDLTALAGQPLILGPRLAAWTEPTRRDRTPHDPSRKRVTKERNA